jgi:hypothetical protein
MGAYGHVLSNAESPRAWLPEARVCPEAGRQSKLGLLVVKYCPPLSIEVR